MFIALIFKMKSRQITIKNFKKIRPLIADGLFKKCTILRCYCTAYLKVLVVEPLKLTGLPS